MSQLTGISFVFSDQDDVWNFDGEIFRGFFFCNFWCAIKVLDGRVFLEEYIINVKEF